MLETAPQLRGSIEAASTSATQLNGFAGVEACTRLMIRCSLDNTKKFVGKRYA